jgi:hypothetical protein
MQLLKIETTTHGCVGMAHTHASKPKYGGMTGFLRSTSTIVQMDACS